MIVRRLISAAQNRSRKNKRRRLQLAEAAARASYASVWQRVEQRTAGMSAAEARGYIRSISVRHTSCELRQLMIGYPRLAQSEYDSILDRAVDHVVRMIVSGRTVPSASDEWQRRVAA
ncbi:MAG: hypothetical protein MI757_02870 [Pirellulales bacterium]|nr:hypothetical protein [Pirellulales bacterium]